MEMQQLHHFMTVARLGSVGRAAVELNLTQSGLSRSLKTLGTMLGLPLFERRARGVALTEYGESLLPRAQLIWNERLRTLSEMQAFSALQKGRVTLGLHSVFAYNTGPEAIEAFTNAHPDIDVSVLTGADPDMAEWLADGRVDFAFTLFTAGERHADLIYEDLFSLRCGVYCRAAHPLAASPSVEAEDLSTAHWALGGAGALRREFGAFFSSQGLPMPRRVLQSSSLALLLALVKVQDVLTVLPDVLVRTAPIVNDLVRLDTEAPGGRPRGGLIYRPDLVQTKASGSMFARFRMLATQLA